MFGGSSRVQNKVCSLLRMSATLPKTDLPHKVHHDETKMVFFIDLDEGNKAVLNYEKIGPKVLDLYHTEVPSQFQGRGLGKILAKTALDYIVKNDYQVKPSCWYIKDYVTKTPLPEYTSRIYVQK